MLCHAIACIAARRWLTDARTLLRKMTTRVILRNNVRASFSQRLAAIQAIATYDL